MDRYFADRLDGADEVFDASRYPMSTADLITEFGAYELQYPNGDNGREPLREIFERMGPDVYDTPHEARLAVFTAVSADAVGRRYYSDRDPPILGSEQLPAESF